jgi:D-glycero-alpha-D-manno-heptose-7-phosphate kinase
LSPRDDGQIGVESVVVYELEHSMPLCYTGKTRVGSHHRGRDEALADERALEGLRADKALAVEMKNALLQRRLIDFGDLLATAWDEKKKSRADRERLH